MLVLFFGPSGVGKTSLMERLRTEHEWRYVPTYMSRPPRVDEVGKISVPAEQFEKMEKDGRFICVNALFGYSYGTPADEIETAVHDAGTIWMMDFPLARRDAVFASYPHLGFIILPAGEEQLRTQVVTSGRADRLDAILNDYRKHYEQFNHTSPPGNLAVIVNRSEMLNYAIQEIVQFTVAERCDECAN